ncbi:MAG: LamG domain-containing protein, partial [Cyanobacteria bacterium J06598_3]
VEMPFGDESLSYNYQGASRLAQKGYYELPDGSRGTIIEEYFADRVTGEVIKYPFLVKFNRNENWWTDGAPNLGKLDPNKIGEPKKVKLPGSKFRLNQGPIEEVDPIKPTNPVDPNPDPVNPNPDPVNPNPDPVNPDPVEPDPVDPGPGAPTDPTDPTDPVDPIEPGNPTNPEPPKPPVQPIDTMKPSLANLKPVASYSFETGSGATAEDTSKAGTNHTGALWKGVAWGEGVDGNGLTMDGTGSVRIKNSRDINKGIHQERSLSLWFKADKASGKKQVLYEEGGAARGLNTYIDEEGLLYVGGWNRPRSQSKWEGSWLESEAKVTDGKWHHVAVVLDGNEQVTDDALTAYLDGKTIGSDEGSQLWSHGNPTALGSIAGNTRFHDGVGKGDQGLIGSLDETHIFNQALTGNQVKALASQF